MPAPRRALVPYPKTFGSSYTRQIREVGDKYADNKRKLLDYSSMNHTAIGRAPAGEKDEVDRLGTYQKSRTGSLVLVHP